MIARFALLACSLVAALAAADPATSHLDYRHGDTPLRGFLALPGGPAKGAVLVVPEWWGMNAYAERRARELAQAGYAALACDMYGAGKVTDDPTQAGAWAGPFYQDRALMVARARAGLEQLRAQPAAAGAAVSAIGFCFGGTVVLELARAGEPIKVAASFHGGLKAGAPAAPGAVKAHVLVLHGGADPLVPADEVGGFIAEMVAAKADWRMEVYGTALHAFTNPKARELNAKLPAVDYDPAAEAAAFARLHEALAR
jgi:dienelactone hydrolase